MPAAASPLRRPLRSALLRFALLGSVAIALSGAGIEPAHADSKAKVETSAAAKADSEETDPEKTDSESTEAPKADAPEAEAPKTEAPKADAPKAGAPKTEAPKSHSSRADAQKTGAQRTDSQKTERKHSKKKRKKPALECRRERPQRFLERPHFMKGGMLLGTQHQRALRWRVERYGSVEGLGLEGFNSDTAFSHAASVRFFGLPLTVHEKIVPALRCVEHQIRKRCKDLDERYTPHAVGGFRQSNTYRGGEVSNHLFGIAIDIDPDRNPCCGCVAPWPEHKLCQHPEKPIYERTSLPRCWIEAFENHGFYWLGHDELEDTMHFEYLGNPDREEP